MCLQNISRLFALKKSGYALRGVPPAFTGGTLFTQVGRSPGAYCLLPAARTAEMTTLPLISDTGAPLEQSQMTLLKPWSMGP